MKQTKILSFDSVYIVAPIRNFYLRLIDNLSVNRNYQNNRLVLYRLDSENVFLNDERNISGENIGVAFEEIDGLSVKFYKHFEKYESVRQLSIDSVALYHLYPRQLKLKLEGVLRAALRIINLIDSCGGKIEIVTDKQTMSIMNEAFIFLNYPLANVSWNINGLLSFCISINSFLLRGIAIVNMYISRSKFPREYLYLNDKPNVPTVLITTPKNRPADFFSMYVDQLSNRFNIVLYCCGKLEDTPKNFKRLLFRNKKRILKGFFKFRSLFLTTDSYIFDILLINKKHTDLNMSTNVVNALFSNQIDVHISRLQTNPVDTHIAIEARKRKIFILGDMEEEIFYCDTAICSSESENTESLRLAVAQGGGVTYKGSNSMMNYRFEHFTIKSKDYLRRLLKIDRKKKIIFYASAPSKEEKQKYLTEKFLIEYFSNVKDHVLVMKTHPQDSGRVSYQAFLDSPRPRNVILIGDMKQRGDIVSQEFHLFEGFDFNAALASSDGFLTMSSSSILQAIMLGVKTGVVDMFNNGFYDHLVNHEVSMLVDNENSMQQFLNAEKQDVAEEVLSYFGLKNSNSNFDFQTYLLCSMKDFYQKPNSNNSI